MPVKPLPTTVTQKLAGTAVVTLVGGATPDTAGTGGVGYWNLSAEVPPGVVTVTSMVPRAEVGTSAARTESEEIWNWLVFVTVMLPKEKAVAPVKPLPRMATQTVPVAAAVVVALRGARPRTTGTG